MRFDKFLRTLDMGNCEDQLQKEALIELSLLFIVIDGEVDHEEEAILQQWLSELDWNSQIEIQAFYDNALIKAKNAVSDDDIEHFIAHRSSLLMDSEMKTNVVKLAEEIVKADGVLHESEQAAFALLKSYVG